MIYFDNAATGGFKPDGVTGAVSAAIKNCANPGRSGHKLSLARAERVYAVRKLTAEFFNAPSADKVIFTKNCTEALNIALLGGFKAGDKIVTTVAEHNSVLRPLHVLEKRGVSVTYVPYDEEKIINAANVGATAVVVTLASNVTGASVNAAKIRAEISPETLLICDGAQSCGHVATDMNKCGIDALAVAGHKGMLAIQGSGALVLSKRFNPTPVTYGGTGSDSMNKDMPDFYPDKLESGTLSYPAIISLGEGALYLKNHLEENRERVLYLTELMIKGLQKIAEVTLYSVVNPYGIVAFKVKDMQSEMTALKLSEYSICVRGGLHCAPLMHKSLSSDGLVRASLSAFNNEREIDYFLRTLKAVVEGRA